MKKLLFTCFTVLCLQQLSAAILVIRVNNLNATPKEITVQSGDTIRFIWEQGTHVITANHPGWQTFQLSPQLTHRDIILTAAATYNFYSVNNLAVSGRITVLESLLGLKNTQAKFGSVTIFPNPVANLLTIKHNYSKIDFVKIHDVLGKEMKKQFVNPTQADRPIEIDVSSFPKGIYFVSLHADGLQLFSRRVLKNVDNN